MWDVSVEGLTLMRQLIRRFSIDCDWVDGTCSRRSSSATMRELHAELTELRDDYGYPSVRYMPREELRATLATERYLGALYDSNSGHLHPLNYTLGLAAAAEALGVRIFEGTRAAVLRRRGRLEGAHRDARPAKCAPASWCCAATSTLAPPPRRWLRKIMAVATYIVATEPLGAERARALITNNAAVSDMNWVLDYYRRSADHRLLFGGRVNYSGLKSFDAPSATRARMLGRVSAAQGRAHRVRLGRAMSTSP